MGTAAHPAGVAAGGFDVARPVAQAPGDLGRQRAHGHDRGAGRDEMVGLDQPPGLAAVGGHA
ncbi:hypothetical protein ACFOWE_07070 [Planomonospora corallina]|uniref:Uncharacterized protein n=1 Tax=Planomonospora corallina TaxID=1806052 RepID=A0ABV8I828_9ACTN